MTPVPEQDPSSVPSISLAQPPVQESSAHGIFIGRFGLRAGWGIAIFISLVLVFSLILGAGVLAARGKLKETVTKMQQSKTAQKAPSSAPAAKAQESSSEMTPKFMVLGEGFQFAALGLAAWVLSRIERRRLAVYGIDRSHLRDILPGAFWGLATLSLLVALLRGFHVLVFDGRALAGAAILIFGAKWLLAFLLVGLVEEYTIRGYIQYTFTRGVFGLAERLSSTRTRAIAFWIAAFFMSVIFGALHLGNSGENRMGIVMVFIAGILFSYALWRTGSLWWGIGFHMTWDWAQSFLYGVPDSGTLSSGRLFHTHPVGNILISGGSVGPEGSLLVIPVLLIVFVVLRFTRAGEQPPLSPLDLPQELPQPGLGEAAPAL